MVWSILTENNQAGSGKISPKECSDHTKFYGYTFPELRDEGTAHMRKYFDRNAVPFNMIITTHDMKIIYKLSGALSNRIEGTIKAHLGQ